MIYMIGDKVKTKYGKGKIWAVAPSGHFYQVEIKGNIYNFHESDLKENPRMYPGFRGGAKRPTIEFRYIKVPGGRKSIKDEPGLSTFVKTRYTITFMHNGKKKKQVVWARDQAEAFAMIRDLYPGLKGELKKNPRGSGIPIDQIQLNLMTYAYFDRVAYPDSLKEGVAIRKLVQAELMEITHQDDVYKLTPRGRKLLSEYFKEQEKYI